MSQDYTGDPNDMENVPSFREAKQYLDIVRVNHKLTDAELNRVILLAGYTKYPPTATFSMSTGSAALEFMDNPEPARGKFLETVLNNLKCSDSAVRQVAMSTIGNMKATECAQAIVPFLKSAEPKERSAARRSLMKLGYQFPPEPKPPGE